MPLSNYSHVYAPAPPKLTTRSIGRLSEAVRVEKAAKEYNLALQCPPKLTIAAISLKYHLISESQQRKVSRQAAKTKKAPPKKSQQTDKRSKLNQAQTLILRDEILSQQHKNDSWGFKEVNVFCTETFNTGITYPWLRRFCQVTFP